MLTRSMISVRTTDLHNRGGRFAMCGALQAGKAQGIVQREEPYKRVRQLGVN